MKWISVGDRLPQHEQRVLVWDGEDLEYAEYWGQGETRWARCGDYRTIKGVTHWAEVKGPEEGDRL